MGGGACGRTVNGQYQCCCAIASRRIGGLIGVGATLVVAIAIPSIAIASGFGSGAGGRGARCSKPSYGMAVYIRDNRCFKIEVNTCIVLNNA